MKSVFAPLLALPLLLTAGSKEPVVSIADGQGSDFLLLTDGRIFLDVDLDFGENDQIIVHFENGDIAVPGALVQDVLIADAPLPEPKNDEEREKFADGLVRYDGKWMSIKKRDKLVKKLIAERRDELEGIRARREWRNRHREETKHFAFETTAPPNVFESYRDQLEAYFKVFAKDWRVKPPKENPRLKICMYVDEEQFLQVGGVPRGVLGYFRFVDPMELNFFYDRQDPVFTTEVLFHEANHYMQKLIDLDFKMPHFPGEAIAEYYGGAHWDNDNKKLTVGLILPSRLVEVKTDIAGGKYWGLKELVAAGRAYQHYTWGWTLAHFLMKTPKYEKNFKKFVIGLAKDKKVRRTSMSIGSESLRAVEPDQIWETFMRFMKLKDDEAVAELEKEWHDYIDNVLVVEGLRSKEAAGMGALRGYPKREIRGTRLLTEAIEEGSLNPLVYMTLAKEHYYNGKREEAKKLFAKAVSFDPLSSESTFWLGRTMLRTGEKEEGKRLIALAQEMGINDPAVQWILEQDIEEEVEEAD